jgi:hypothetical protein
VIHNPDNSYLLRKRRQNPKTTPVQHAQIQARQFQGYRPAVPANYHYNGTPSSLQRRLYRNNNVHEKYKARAAEVQRYEEQKSRAREAKMAPPPMSYRQKQMINPAENKRRLEEILSRRQRSERTELHPHAGPRIAVHP